MLAIATESSAAFPTGGSGEVVIWWGFSSCSTNQQPVMEFLNKDGVAVDRVLYTIEGGSSARDVRRYSHYPEEDEVLLPFGSTFVVTTASQPDPNGTLLLRIFDAPVDHASLAFRHLEECMLQQANVSPVWFDSTALLRPEGSI